MDGSHLEATFDRGNAMIACLQPLRLFKGIAFLIFAQSSRLLATDLDPGDIRGKTNLSPVTILQNRYFVKTLRPELGISYGTLVNEAYTDTSLYGFRGALFLNEWVGIEFQSYRAKVKDSDDRRALNKLKYRRIDVAEIVSPDPEVNPLKSVTDINAIVAPFYGKLNFSDWLIVYSDVYLTGGISRVATMQGNLNALNLGIGQRLYWQKNLSFRVDFRDRIYTEKRGDQDSRKNSYSVDVGLSYFLF
jgi:outer membrane beta-barrel protein